MKTLKYYIGFMLCACCFSGCAEEDEPEVCNIVVTTQEATLIGNTSATLSLQLSGAYGTSYKTGILYGANASLIDAKDASQSGYNSSQFSEKIESLKSNTTYYFKGYIEDKWGNRIEGTTRTFTTKSEPFSITTGTYVQTSAQYKYQGFIGENGKFYNYSYSFILSATLINSENVSSWGIVWFDKYYELYYGDVREGTLSRTFSAVSNSSSGSATYRAYAKFKDGTYQYGSIKTLTFRY